MDPPDALNNTGIIPNNTSETNNTLGVSNKDINVNPNNGSSGPSFLFGILSFAVVTGILVAIAILFIQRRKLVILTPSRGKCLR